MNARTSPPPLFLFLTLWTLVAVALPAAPQVGETAPDIRFKDIRFVERSLSDLGTAKLYVIAFTTLDCPVAQRYLPVLNSLHKEFQSQGVQFVSLNVGAEDGFKQIAFQAVDRQLEFPVAKDVDCLSAKALGVTRTPEVVVIDQDKKIRYRGRIDNQYRVGGSRNQADRHDLKDAIQALLAGKSPETLTTPVDGCLITFPEKKTPTRRLTYAEHIAPLMNKHCVECHRPNTEAPFALNTYEKVAAKARMIAEVVSEERMPPWFAHPEYGKFQNQRVLTSEEKQLITDWALGEKAAGDLSKVPPTPVFSDDKWLIGTPDIVIAAAKEEIIQPTGYIDYRYIVLPYMFTQDTWVQGVQIQPSNTRVVHHANLAYASLGKGYDEATSFITGRVPGGIPVKLTNGIAMLIPKGSVLALQIHYVTTGKEERDRIAVGLKYAQGTIQKKVRYKILGNYTFRIPPFAGAHPVSATKELECDATGIGLFQHMHLRGKDTTFIAHYPDGKKEIVLAIPNYSFDWQLGYVWEKGFQFPKGTKLECSSHFDNSPFNPYNPDPKSTVKNGPQTHHEMMQGFFFYTDNAEQLNMEVDPKTGREVKKSAGN